MALLEVCAADIASVRAAVEGGAHRIELCTGLSADGMTPSPGLIRAAREITQGRLKMNVLMRPNEDPGFVISHDDYQIILDDIEFCADQGVDGVVIGALTPQREIDIETTGRLVKYAKDLGLSVTFHRAFDITPDPVKALRTLTDLGCDRVLTSGQASSAQAGIELLNNLVRMAGDNIIIMPGAGINPSNCADILAKTNCREMHSSCREPGATSSSPRVVAQIVDLIK